LRCLREREAAGDYTGRLALLEETKALPWGLVWDHYCATAGVAGERHWLDEIKAYERGVLSARELRRADHPAARSCGVRAGADGRPVRHGIDAVQRQFQKPPADSRIMMRWWWFGPSQTRDQLDAEMRRMKEGGIGGFEVATVYPLAVDDPATGLHNYPYLSRSSSIASRSRPPGARARPADGPHDRQRLVVRRPLHHAGARGEPPAVERREITPGVTSIARPEPFDHDRLVAAFVGLGSVQEADPATYRPLDIPEHGPIPLPPGQGPRVVLLYFSAQTGQTVKRAASGAEGYVLDHYKRRHSKRTFARRATSCSPPRPRLHPLGVLRQPRGLRGRLDDRSAPGIPAAPRLRSPAPAADRRARQRRRADASGATTEGR
jgi:hypothetical protein